MLKPLFLLLGLFAVGCGPSLEKRVYDVSVHNEANQPITLWLTKNGPAYERGWKSPEDQALEMPRNQHGISGVIVDPGKTAFTGPHPGKFAYNTSAYLRVYLGQLSINEILAISKGSERRADIRLPEGKSDWTVYLQGRQLMVEPSHNSSTPAQ
jgi:hypothetical protein